MSQYNRYNKQVQQQHSQYSKRVQHYINSGAFTRQSLPYNMPKGSSLETEVEKIEQEWKNNNTCKIMVQSSITYRLLIERFHGQKGLLPIIAEQPSAADTFAFYPSSLGPLEIKDKNGVLLGWRFRINKDLVQKLANTDSLLPDRTPRRRGGGGDPTVRGVFDARHYTVWADYGKRMRENKEMIEDMPASQEWLTSNHEIFEALSHELRMQDPDQYKHLTGAVVKQMGKIKSNSMDRNLKPLAGAYHRVAINRGQTGGVSRAHQDWLVKPLIIVLHHTAKGLLEVI